MTLLIALAWAPAPLVAQPGAQPQRSVVTEADITKAQRSQPTITDRDIDIARRRHTPPPGTTDRASTATPRIDAFPQPATPAPDLGAIAQGLPSVAIGLANPLEPTLLVFISLSMPEPALTRLVDQASRAGAPLILRGLSNGSLTETVTRVKRLIGQRSVGVQIDPQAYDRYGIGVVPAFVLTGAGARTVGCESATCIQGDSFVKATGDVSLDHALRQLGRSSAASARAARPYLQRLER